MIDIDMFISSNSCTLASQTGSDDKQIPQECLSSFFPIFLFFLLALCTAREKGVTMEEVGRN